jgi:Flp pilus assembly protein TadG
MMRFKPSTFGRDEKGAVTIEFLMTIPLFLAALAFSFEFGRVFLAYQQTVNNVRAATRYLTRVETETGSQRAAARLIADRIVRTGEYSQDTGATGPDYLEDANINVNVPNPDTSDRVTITVRVNFRLTLFGLTDRNGDAPTSFPFTIRERGRHMGM